jgi:predicted nucleotidyltransferase
VTQDPNLSKIEMIASALGPLRDRLVFVGGCAVGLLITNNAAAPVRVTFDVDLVARVEALPAYHGIEKEFVRLGFSRDTTSDAPICRWRYRGLEVDLMPMDSKVLGFANRWYPLAVETAQDVKLPSGTTIKLITAPAFLATKFEAYSDRGEADMLASHDLEDIINVVDGRPSLLEEVRNAPVDLRSYLMSRFAELLMAPDFLDVLPALIFPDESLAERTQVVTERIRLLAHQCMDKS